MKYQKLSQDDKQLYDSLNTSYCIGAAILELTKCESLNDAAPKYLWENGYSRDREIKDYNVLELAKKIQSQWDKADDIKTNIIFWGNEDYKVYSI